MPDIAAESTRMPSASEVVELYTELRHTFAARNADYDKLRRMVAGEHWDGTNLVAKDRRYSLVFNYLRSTVRGDVRDLVGRMPSIQVLPPGTRDDERRQAENEEAILYGTWELNEAPRVLRLVARNMIVLGRGLFYYWWDPKSERVRFRSVAPDDFYPVYDGDDIVECVRVSRRNTLALRAAYPRLADKIHSDDALDAHRGITSGVSKVVAGTTDALSDNGVQVENRERLSGYTTVFDWYSRDGGWVRVMGDAEHRQNLGYGTGRVPFHEASGFASGDETDPENEIDDILELNQYLDQLVSMRGDMIVKYANPTVLDEQTGQSPEAIKRAISADGAVLPIRLGSNLRYLNWEGTPAEFDAQIQLIREAIYDLSGRPASSYGQTMTNQSGVMTNLSLTPTTVSNEDRSTALGLALTRLNEDILRLYEKFMAGKTIEFRGTRSAGVTGKRQVVYAGAMKGSEIKGWYKNRIIWPSMLRTDDPIFVQNELAKMQSTPPAQSVYTTLQNLGIEDVEAEIDRIAQQLEDPRFNPAGLESAVNIAKGLTDSSLPPGMEGLDPGAGPEDGMVDAMTAAGNPNRDTVAGY